MYKLIEKKISKITPFSVVASNEKLKNIRIEGKSIQQGIPTPEQVAEIKSVGDGVNLIIEQRNKTSVINEYTIPLSQPLRSLPNGIKDTIEEDGIHRRVGNVVFNGTENWQYQRDYDLDNTKQYVLLQSVSPKTFNVISNRFNTEKTDWNDLVTLDEEMLQIYLDGETYIRINSNRASTAQELKNWLANNNVEIQYELKEEVIEPFTPQQQAVINSMQTFEGVNNFNIQGEVQTILKFDYTPHFTQELKDAFKYNITRAYIKVIGTGLEINEDNYLQNVDFDDCRYVESEGIIGTTIAKEISGSFVNVDSSFDIENEELEYYLGAELYGETYYMKLGTFIVQKPENDNVKDNTKFEALDYMIKFNQTYVDRIHYPCTLTQLLQDICEQVGVTCGTTTFRNSEFVVENNQFVNGESCRDVLKAIAQVAFSWARIDEEDRLVLDFDVTDNISEEITMEEYVDLKTNKEYGPVNTIILRNSQVEGENITIRNEESIQQYGPTEIVIADNPFAYTQAKRSQLINAGARLYNFRYVPLEVKTIGFPYLNCKDKIKVINMQGNAVTSYIFNNKISYRGTITDIKESVAMTKTETKYQYTGNIETSLKRTEIIVNKNTQEIQGIISNIGDRSEKTTTITADIDKLNVSIEEIAELTKTVEGIGRVELDNTTLTEIQELIITGNIEVATLSDDVYGYYGTVPSTSLAPMVGLPVMKSHTKSNALYFSDETLLKDLTLIHVKADNTIEKILLPDFKLRTYYNTKDELIISQGKIKLIQKIGVDSAGFLYVLNENIILDLGDLSIFLTEGNESFYLEGFENAHFSATYMIKNNLSENFATKVELNSKLELTSQTFEVELSKKVDNEDITGAKILLAINNDESQASIKADKISLEGTVTANGNFKVFEDGSIEATNGSFSGNIFLQEGGQVVGGDGIYGNLQFISQSDMAEGGSGFSSVGFLVDYQRDENVKRYMQIFATIPENFTIDKAIVTLIHQPIHIYLLNPDYASSSWYWGYSRNIGIYKSEIDEYYEQPSGEPIVTLPSMSLIYNAFGNSSVWQPSVANDSVHNNETKKTIDIKDYLQTGATNRIVITTDDYPPTFESNIQQNEINCARLTGRVYAILDIYGYMKK